MACTSLAQGPTGSRWNKSGTRGSCHSKGTALFFGPLQLIPEAPAYGKTRTARGDVRASSSLLSVLPLSPPPASLEPFPLQGKTGLRHLALKLQEVLSALGLGFYDHPVALALNKPGSKPYSA